MSEVRDLIPKDCCPDEEWRRIGGFSDYYVSSCGRVASTMPLHLRPAAPHLLAGGLSMTGYPYVILRRDKRNRTVTRHRLVALAFHGPRPEAPVGVSRIEICHKNGDRTDAHASNLRYGTPKQNAADAISHGTHTSLALKAKTHCKRGHEFTPENTLMTTAMKGSLVRNCRKCKAMHTRAYYARKKAAAS